MYSGSVFLIGEAEFEIFLGIMPFVKLSADDIFQQPSLLHTVYNAEEFLYSLLCSMRQSFGETPLKDERISFSSSSLFSS
jgi:hypothetical protein